MNDMEEAVLAAALIDRDCVPMLIDIVNTENMFASPKNKIIWQAIKTLYSRGLAVDIITVTEQVAKLGGSEIVSPLYITQLTNRVANAAHVETHAMILKEQYIRRETETECLKTIQKCKDVTQDSLEIIAEHTTNIEKISVATDMAHEKTMLDVVMSIAKTTDKNSGNISYPLIQSPKGFRNGDLIILAARPSMGKTAFALSIAEQAADDGYVVGVLSLEMTARGLVSRMISGRANIAFERVEANDIRIDEEEKYLEVSDDIANLPIYIDDQSGISDMQAKAKASRMKAKYGINLLIVDYLQLLHAADKKINNREQEITRISGTLKTIAKQLDIPVIALSQLSRRVEERGGDKKPMLSDLRESGSIEQDADIVMFLYRPEYYGIMENAQYSDTSGLCEVIVAKHRNGALHTTPLRYTGHRFMFSKWDGETKEVKLKF